ncbi:MAG TPA: transposase [Fervidobacterium sp.]|nr:transposase [Fervidobacterium sp.]HPT59530.1 transposase [Fervidobacterium sp.]
MLDPYKVQIESMLSEKRSNRDIFEILRTDGYRGSYSNLGIYISKMKRELGIEVVKEHQVRISKKDLIKLMYKPIEECEVVMEGMYEKIIGKYPIIKRMVDLIARFKEIMKSSEVEMLEEWMAEAKSLRIRKIDKFVKGMKRDIEAVRNAIRYEYNNGLAEGSVNKLKVIKRIMYGRSKFGLLRAKLLLIEGNG